jgi:hypothetical protein
MEGSVKFMNNIKWDASYKSLGHSVLGSFGCNSTVKDSILVATQICCGYTAAAAGGSFK